MASAATIHRHGVQQWLQRHCESSDAVAGGVVVVSGEQASKPDTVAEWPSDSKLTASLASAAQAAVQRARPVVLAPAVRLAGSNHNRVISLPLRSGERTLGAVALAVRAEDTQTLEQLFRELATASSDIGPVLGPDEESSRSARVARVLAMQTALLAPRTLADGATALVTEMAAATGSVRVTLGIAEPDMRVIAMSNSAEVHRQQALVRNMADAMQEATDQGARVCCPSLPTDPARVVVSHRELQHRTLHSLMTVPLVSSGKAIGALMLEFNSSTPADPALVELAEAVAASVGPLVYLRRRAERPWWQRLLAALRAGRRRLGRRGDPLPKLALLAGVAALAAALFVPLPYRVGAAARIEGSVQRVVAAPFDGFLQRSHVRPGDSVKAGDVLVELADSDLVLEQRKWESTLAQQQNAFEAALGDRVIKATAHMLGEGLRTDDLLGRYGGEEFCIVLPGVTVDVAMQVAERLRASIETSSQVPVRGEQAVAYTSSFGVATIRRGARSLQELVDQADQALYKSKTGGRNRVTAFSRA